MKKLSLFLVTSLFMSLSANAQSLFKPGTKKVNAEELKATHNPNDVTFLAVPENVDGLFKGTPQLSRMAHVAKQLPSVTDAVTDTVPYFAIAQSFHANYQFNYDGGDIYSYNIGLAINGTKATLTNLFDMYNQSATAYSRSYDYPVDGVYDADAKTITIPTTESGIVCGNYGGYYDAILVAGTINESGTMTPVGELVFDVTTDDDGSIATITSRNNFAAQYPYGTIRVYKSFTANIPKAGEANFKSFTESIDFGEAFINTSVDKTLTIYNTGGMDADYAMELESDDDAITSTALTGTVPAHSSYTIPFTFKAAKAGQYEGIATITYESGNEEKNLVVDLGATTKNYPDYSAAIKSGNFDVTTNIEFPFEMTTLDDGTPVAQSGTHGKYGTSWLNLDFTVPEGKLAKISWKGVSNNSGIWYQNAGGYFIDTLDGAAVALSGANEDLTGEHEFAPGKHFIRFQYEGKYYTGSDENRLYVYDIAYAENILNADSAEIKTPEVSLGSDVLKEGGRSVKTGSITLKNNGANDLVVKKVTSSNPEFTADLSGLSPVGTMQEVSIPVTMETTTIGDKQTTFTIETSAGTFTATAKASVIAMPDFASLVTEGAEYIANWEVNPEAPFIIKDGKAANMNAGNNSVAETAWFKMNLNIPEGKVAFVSWEGQSYGRPEDKVNYSHNYSSYATVEMSHPMSSGTIQLYSVRNAGSESLDGSWKDLLACIPGSHYFKWGWYHNGDGTTPEGDCVEISNIKIHVMDLKADNVELVTPEVNFDTIYVGNKRYAKANVTLKNTGSNPLKVGSITGEAPFYGLETTNTAQFNKTVDVELWFYPSEPGEFNGEVTVETSAGDVKVKCHGVAKNAADEGYIYYGDFENEADGWTTSDEDRDGETWNLGSNLWGEWPAYCHSGSDCLASISYSNYLGAVTPDNWTLSPVITIPAEGAKLSYYVAAFSPTKFEEHYSMYIQPYDENTFSIDQVKLGTPVISETLKEENGAVDGWSRRDFDLNDYAGQKIVICFRHHDCTGQYLLRLDDVNVMTNEAAAGVNTITRNIPGNSVEYFTVDGRKSNVLSRGLNIVRSQKEDGTTVVRKVVR